MTIKKYADIKFEYLSYCLQIKEMDDEEYAAAGSLAFLTITIFIINNINIIFKCPPNQNCIHPLTFFVLQ